MRGLREIADLSPEARKLLSFTDNRQDASLQAGHFNDFVEVGLLRGPSTERLRRGDGSAATSSPCAWSQALGIAVRGLCLESRRGLSAPPKDAEDALRDVIGYRVFQDLARGWRISAPNLEQTGLSRIAYESLDEIAGGRFALARTMHSVVAGAIADERRAACKALLDYFRRELAIKTPLPRCGIARTR